MKETKTDVVQDENGRVDVLASRIEALIAEARTKVASVVNTAMVYTYYEIGRYIVEDEQNGASRASYGKEVLENLSCKLTDKFGKGWSAANLRAMRQFYMVYSKMLTTGQQIGNENANRWSAKLTNQNITPEFKLSWTHYQILMRVENPQARSFYEIECYNQQWDKRYLQRQIGSSLYERLALSRDKDEIIRLAKEGQTIEKPSDIIKDPVVLEFMGLKSDASYSETALESAIINKLQQFLLEMGKGFLFEARQKRFSFEERNFYVDLVLYNRLLQCYVLVDLKMDDLTHQDLGQMQMYVNYYDRYVKQDFEKPTIGILLCERKNDALVELTLPTDANVYAQQYALYLPDKNLLQNKLREWIDEQNENQLSLQLINQIQ
ncbi:MAG: PDDEXK nuclease domain-containing protein [Bacteroidales bacterium]|nr:PDDEXK nuclease domain-containing protein [Bacteroidales bacterium]